VHLQRIKFVVQLTFTLTFTENKCYDRHIRDLKFIMKLEDQIQTYIKYIKRLTYFFLQTVINSLYFSFRCFKVCYVLIKTTMIQSPVLHDYGRMNASGKEYLCVQWKKFLARI